MSGTHVCFVLFLVAWQISYFVTMPLRKRLSGGFQEKVRLVLLRCVSVIFNGGPLGA